MRFQEPMVMQQKEGKMIAIMFFLPLNILKEYVPSPFKYGYFGYPC